MEKTFIITYTWPLRYQGTYVVKAKDGFEAGDKVKKYLCDKYGDTKDSYSVVMNVIDNQLIYV